MILSISNIQIFNIKNNISLCDFPINCEALLFHITLSKKLVCLTFYTKKKKEKIFYLKMKHNIALGADYSRGGGRKKNCSEIIENKQFVQLLVGKIVSS